MVLISLKQKEGYTSSSNNRTCIVLDTELDEDLILEGLAREFVRKVQSLRKEYDFVITDHINIYYEGDTQIDKMLTKFSEYIKQETLAEIIEKKPIDKEEEKLNEVVCKIDVEKI